MKKAGKKNSDAGKTFILISSSCSSCQKAIEFFDQNKISYIVENFYKKPISDKRFKDILSLSEDGTESLFSKRADQIKATNSVSVEELSISELIKLVRERPSLLRRPIIIQYNSSGIPKRMRIGYNSSEIKVFERKLIEPKPIIQQ
ncbi:Spx/MgsR family RNA polymerase-binding regulatory protein [Mycoplasmoides genitalium]